MASALLVRHALSEWNEAGRWQGQADPPLSQAGEDQARRAAERLADQAPFDALVTSDLARARRTGELLMESAGHYTHIVEPLFREFDVGAWSGLTRTEIQLRWPEELALFDAGRLPAPPGGETRDAFESRVLEAASRLGGLRCERVLVVSHGGLIRRLARLQGLADVHLPQLCGYSGVTDRGGLRLTGEADLLRSDPPCDVPAGGYGRNL